MSGTAQQHIHAVTFDTLEMVASQPAIVFQITEDWLNRLAPFQTSPDAGGYSAPLSRDVNRVGYGLIFPEVTE